MEKTLRIEATLTLEDADILIGDTDQSRNWFWEQLNNHAFVVVGGELGDQVGPLSDIRITALNPES